jgi:regulator of RNase E activity RraA
LRIEREEHRFLSYWSTEAELIELIRRELFTAVIGDVMDRLGLQRQFLPPAIQPLSDEMVLVGRAMPVLSADVVSPDASCSEGESGGRVAENPVMARPFGLMLRALDDLHPGEVYLCTGGSPRYALWGELMSTRARLLGAAGAVLDGYARDSPGIIRLGFPTFAIGRYAQDQGPRGKVIDFRCVVEIGGVRVAPGDLLVGDLEGVLVIPREAAGEIIPLAIEKARGEKLVRRAIEEGMSASEAFEKYGIM